MNTVRFSIDCVFQDVNRTQQVGSQSQCLNGNNAGCLIDNNDQPCVTGTPDCYTNTQGDRYGLLSTSTTTFETAFPQSFGYNAATGLGSVNVANLVLNWQATQGGYMLTVNNNIYGDGSVVVSGDGFIDCPGACSHYYAPNSLVTLIAIAPPGKYLYTWGGACGGTGYCVLTMSADLSLHRSSPTFTVTRNLSVTATGSGTVTSSPRGVNGGINCPGICSDLFPQNAQVTSDGVAGLGLALRWMDWPLHWHGLV